MSLALALLAAGSVTCQRRDEVVLRAGDEFHAVLPEVVLRVSLRGHDRMIEAVRKSPTERFRYNIHAAGRVRRCRRTPALEAGLQKTFSVRVLETLPQTAIEELAATPANQFVVLEMTFDMQNTDPFLLRLLAPRGSQVPAKIRACTDDGKVGFVTEGHLLDLFEIDCA